MLICLRMTCALYGIGIRRLWSTAGRRGIVPWRVASFATGWLTLALALLSPIHRLGETYFWDHMIKHELLMLVAAPLLVLGFPLLAMIWALPLSWRQGVGRLSRARPIQLAWRGLTHPLISWSLGAAALWLWHAPALFQRALESETLHAAQHLSFLLTALVFWWVLLDLHPKMRPGVAVMYLFTTLLQTGALGALLTLASQPWYPWYALHGTAVGLTPLQDQQLGGLIMWIPGGLVYLAAILWTLARWMRKADHVPVDPGWIAGHQVEPASGGEWQVRASGTALLSGRMTDY